MKERHRSKGFSQRLAVAPFEDLTQLLDRPAGDLPDFLDFNDCPCFGDSLLPSRHRQAARHTHLAKSAGVEKAGQQHADFSQCSPSGRSPASLGDAPVISITAEGLVWVENGSLLREVLMVTAAALKEGMVIRVEGQIYKVLEVESKAGAAKLGGVVRTS